MEKAERETLITWTQADLESDPPFFCFYTADRNAYERLLRRIGGQQNLLSCETSFTRKGAFLGVNCRVPAQYLSLTTFSIRKPKTVRVSEARTQALRAYNERRKQEAAVNE
jgi:hypothetical protein